MIPSLGAQLFWMIAIGLTIGYAGHFIFLKYSIDLVLSITLGALGSIVMGLIAYYFAFELPLMYAVLGAVMFLFIANSFLSAEG